MAPAIRLDIFSIHSFSVTSVLGGNQLTRSEGPIIRINPWAVHICDPEFYDELYNTKSQFSKMPHLKHRFGIPQSTFDLVEHEHHQKRRAAVGPFFARQKVVDFSPYIQSRVNKLCTILENEYKGTPNVVCLNEAWGALAADALTWYTFATSYGFLDYPGFIAPFTTAIRNWRIQFTCRHISRGS